LNNPCHFGIGNRCGHRAGDPRWFVAPEKHGLRPRVLIKLGEKIRAYYNDPAETIPSLNLANGSARQQRSERREACLQLLGAIIHYLDLATLRVGFPGGDGSIQNVTWDFLAVASGLGERRAERAAADLVKSGIITVRRLSERQKDGSYRGLAAIRNVSQDLFAIFGMGRWFNHERRKAQVRRNKRTQQPPQEGRSKVFLLFKSTLRRRSQKRSGQEPTNRTVKLRELLLAHPDRPIEELFSLLRAPPHVKSAQP
jgi:hypothetical protein